jgi:hypothetical protein
MNAAAALDRVRVYGTGEDAAHFVARGVRVRAIAVSAEMVRLRGGFITAVSAAEEISGVEPAKVEA